MFCSGCGRTIPEGGKVCRICGKPVGASRFSSDSHVSNQEVTLPQSITDDRDRFARVSYSEDDFDDARRAGTQYRAPYSSDEPEAEEPFEVENEPWVPLDLSDEASEEETGSDLPDDTVEDINIEGIDLSDYKSENIDEKTKRGGISEDVKQYMRSVNFSTEDKKGASSQSNYRHGKATLENEDVEPERATGSSVQGRVNTVNDDDDEYIDDYVKPNTAKRVIKIIVAAAAIMALFVAGIVFVPKVISRFNREATAPVEGVSLDIYNNTIAMLENNVGEEYRSNAYTIFKNGSYGALSSKLQADSKAIANQLGAEPQTNDQLFLDAASAIQDDIGNAITYDAVEISTNGMVTSEESADRWKSIEDSVASFKNITTASGLSAVLSGERIVVEVPTATPAPQATQVPEYPTLSKGDSSDAVLAVQERLYQLGYLNDDRDGKFGNNTQTAVKLFQQTAGLDVTGVADNATQALLFSDDAPMTSNAKITPTPEPTAEPEPTDFTIEPEEAGSDTEDAEEIF